MELYNERKVVLPDGSKGWIISFDSGPNDCMAIVEREDGALTLEKIHELKYECTRVEYNERIFKKTLEKHSKDVTDVLNQWSKK